ncbi:energy transducer TonB [Flavobacterium sp.]|uniref:energy transducer TonB n=1 Tax=Flavobacterium sp. TaxID=239 RepID=UPI004033C01B
MSKVSVFDQGWIDLVFEGRNHAYGAYQLRKQDSRTTIKAFFTGLGVMSLLIGIPAMANYLKKDVPDVMPNDLPGPVIVEFDGDKTFVEPKPLKPLPQEPAASAPAKNTATTAFHAPVATSDPVTDPAPKTSDFVDSDPGNITSAGNPDSRPDGVPDGTGPRDSMGTGVSTGTGPGLETTATVDKMPGFPGGLEAFYEQVGRKYRVPELEMSRTFKVYVSFVVEKDGTMSDIKVARDPGHGLGAEAIRVLKSIRTKWVPGQKKGQPVRTAYSLPITVNVK